MHLRVNRKIGLEFWIFGPIFFIAICLCWVKNSLAECGDTSYLLLENESGHVLFAAPFQEGDFFAIRYTHSVALSPVTDFFRIKNHEIWLDKTVYHDFGAGLPHEPQSGQTMTRQGSELIISGYDRRLPAFQLRVGRVAGHELLLFEKDSKEPVQCIPLKSLAQPGNVIGFSTSLENPLQNSMH